MEKLPTAVAHPCSFANGRYEDAAQTFRALLVSEKDAARRGKATFNLGLSLQHLARYDEAITIFESLIAQTVNDLEPGGHLMEPHRNYRHPERCIEASMHSNDAKRPQPSPRPPLGDPRCVEKTTRWLVELRAEEADVAQYAHSVMRRHFATANLSMRGGGAEVPTTWSSFCWALYLDLSPLLKDGTHDAMVRALLEDLLEVALLNPGGDADYRLAKMWEPFVDRDPPRSRFKSLLSATALEHLAAVDGMLETWAEEERSRMDQSGY